MKAISQFFPKVLYGLPILLLLSCLLPSSCRTTDSFYIPIEPMNRQAVAEGYHRIFSQEKLGSAWSVFPDNTKSLEQSHHENRVFTLDGGRVFLYLLDVANNDGVYVFRFHPKAFRRAAADTSRIQYLVVNKSASLINGKEMVKAVILDSLDDHPELNPQAGYIPILKLAQKYPFNIFDPHDPKNPTSRSIRLVLFETYEDFIAVDSEEDEG